MQERCKLVKAFIHSGRQTKYFILFCAIYMIAMIWTTLQAYARLQYSRSDDIKSPIIIQAPVENKQD